MNDSVDLPTYRFAALVAPAIDRIFTGAMRAAREAGGAELSQRYGGPAATGFLIDFRTRLAAPGGTVSGAGFAAVTRYGDPAQCQRMLDKQVAHGMIYRTERGGFRATERGSAYLSEIYGLHGRVTDRLWAEHQARMVPLVGTVGRLLVRAALVLLLNRLGTLRYRRADAHAAAWTAAGHTARSIRALTAGPERLAIELETDRRAAGPYEIITPAERLGLLADLAALPG